MFVKYCGWKNKPNYVEILERKNEKDREGKRETEAKKINKVDCLRGSHKY